MASTKALSAAPLTLWQRLRRPVLYTVMSLVALFYLLPIYVMVINSLKTTDQAVQDKMWAWPHGLSWATYSLALAKLGPNFLNTVYLVIPGTVLSALLGSLNGYVLAKWRFRGADALFTVLLFGMFVPYQAVLIPLIRFLQVIGLYNTIPGLILVHIVYGIPITTLIFRNFFANIPQSMIEAATIDGAGILGIFGRIALPLSLPSFVVVGIWQFTSIWNEFLFAVSVTGAGQQPIMVAVQNLAGSQIVAWNLQMSGALMAALPTIVVYVLLSRWYIRGLLAGSVKG